MVKMLSSAKSCANVISNLSLVVHVGIYPPAYSGSQAEESQADLSDALHPEVFPHVLSEDVKSNIWYYLYEVA